jgi:hypothetical protein
VIYTSQVDPSYINVAIAPSTSKRTSFETPSIVELFLSIVKLVVSQFPASAMTIKLPALGVGGRVIVKAPPEVSASI